MPWMREAFLVLVTGLKLVGRPSAPRLLTKACSKRTSGTQANLITATERIAAVIKLICWRKHISVDNEFHLIFKFNNFFSKEQMFVFFPCQLCVDYYLFYYLYIASYPSLQQTSELTSTPQKSSF